MTDDFVSLSPSGTLRSDGAGAFEPSTPGVAVVRRTADAAGESPIDLPPLNGTVDVDALDALLSDGGGEWPTVSFEYAGRSVRVDASGAIAVSDDVAGDGWTHVSPAADADDGGLVVAVTSEISGRSGRDPALVARELEEVVDLEALGRLNASRANGVDRPGGSVRFSSHGYDVEVSPDGSIAIGSTLTRLERTGGNVLLAGAVPDAIVDLASATLLGAGDRSRVFALLDRGVDAVDDRLPAGTAAPVRVVDYASTARSAVDDRSASTPDGGPSADVESFESLADVPPAVVRELSALRSDGSRFESAPPRLCVDSLRPVLEDRSPDGAVAFLEPICEAVADAGALAHYVLPVDRTTPEVAAIEGLFDATVELRAGEDGPEQRWHFRGGDAATEWFPLEDSA